MLGVTLICVGKLNAPYYSAGCAEYQKRIGGYAALRVIELPEEPVSEKNASPSVIQKALEKEGREILAKVPKGSLLIPLCVEGRQRPSEGLAELLASAALAGKSHFTFVIGSSHGLSAQVKAAADEKLSLSKMTFPHQLARLMLLEQIYRALSINAGSRYHK